MIDYWVSFATSLDPNDGRGNARKSQTVACCGVSDKPTLGPHWAQYTPKNEVSFLISLSPFESWVTT
jgi:acetylcholinesterase